MEKPKRKKFRQETVLHSYIVRPLAQEICLVLWNTNITPNQVTLARSILAIIYLMLFAYGEIWSFLTAILLFQVCEILDHVDGMLARMKNLTSSLGQYFEYLSDEFFSTESGFLGLCVSLGVYIYTQNTMFLIAGFVVFLFHYVYLYVQNISNIENNFVTSHDHGSEKMLNIINKDYKTSIKNFILTIYIWKNQLLFIGILFLIGGGV